MNGDMNGSGRLRNAMGGVAGVKLGIESCAVVAVAGLVSRIEFFDGCLSDSNALNIGDNIGIFSYVAEPDLMACAQTRSRRWLSLKCKSEM